MPTTVTFDSRPDSSEDQEPEWALCVALDCERLDAPVRRVRLEGLTEVEIGRGDERSLVRTGKKARLDLADRRASQVHARLTLEGESWVIEDAGSKNGTRVNLAPVERQPLSDGDVIEVAATFLVMRRALGPIRDHVWAPGDPQTLPTLSPSFERELALLPKLAQSRLPILIRGESGTGKEVLATAVHTVSGRTGPLVAVNCGALPATLIESELFGSRKGAFSGAEDRRGLVRNAEKGTLFLDEVAELPLVAQSALLRLLQEGEVLPLGAGKPATVDVRVVVATHRPLEEMVAQGMFRRDLFARLRGYQLRLPPLCDRIEDLGLLVGALLRRIEPGKAARKLSRGAARALFAHRWPYHVRELDQVLRAAIAVAREPEIGAGDLRLSGAGAEPREGGDDRGRFVALLQQHAGNLSAVAREMVTSRSQVQRLLERHALNAADFKRG